MSIKTNGPLNFKEAVQQSSVKQPTQLGFSESEWEKAFRSYTSDTEDDRRVYEAGLWFADQLTAVRQALEAFPDAPCDKSKLWRFYVAAVNREYAVIGNALIEDYSSKAGCHIASGAIIEKRLPIGPGGYPVDLKATIESLVGLRTFVWVGTISGVKTHDIVTNTLSLAMPHNEYSCASEKALAVHTGAFSDAHGSKSLATLSC
jgi:hypothetical protein